MYAARIYAHGRQLAFPLYRAIVTALEAHEGDLVLVRVHLPYVTFCVANSFQAQALEGFTKDQLPPSHSEVLRELAKAVR